MFESTIKIVESETNDLIELARLSGYDSAEFFVGADLSDTDLRGLDFSGYYFSGVNLNNAITDQETIFPSDADYRETRYDLTPYVIEEFHKLYSESGLNPESPEYLLYIFSCFCALSQKGFRRWAEDALNEAKAARSVSEIIEKNYERISDQIAPGVGDGHRHYLDFVIKKTVNQPSKIYHLYESDLREIEYGVLHATLRAIEATPQQQPLITTGMKTRTVSQYEQKILKDMARTYKNRLVKSEEITSLIPTIENVYDFLLKCENAPKERSNKKLSEEYIKYVHEVVVKWREFVPTPWIEGIVFPAAYFLDFQKLEDYIDIMYGDKLLRSCKIAEIGHE